MAIVYASPLAKAMWPRDPCGKPRRGVDWRRVRAHGTGPRRVVAMSVYKVIEIIGTSTTSWEEAASSAVVKARESLRDLRVAEVVKQDLDIGADGAVTYRTKLSVSFKYEDS
jgi:flavin-binding protein dodecin